MDFCSGFPVMFAAPVLSDPLPEWAAQLQGTVPIKAIDDSHIQAATGTVALWSQRIKEEQNTLISLSFSDLQFPSQCNQRMEMASTLVALNCHPASLADMRGGCSPVIGPAWVMCPWAEDSTSWLAVPLETHGKEESSCKGNKDAEKAETVYSYYIIPMCRKKS